MKVMDDGNAGPALHGIRPHRHAAVQHGRGDHRQRVELGQQRDDDAGEAYSTANPIHQAMLLAQHLDRSGQSTQAAGEESREHQAQAHVDTAIASGGRAQAANDQLIAQRASCAAASTPAKSPTTRAGCRHARVSRAG